ncbi:MAG TPA: spore cortex biosynthesis protein YabQ [Bacillus bacterium]|nr:spore cortex biosynthesis protein YabQ [Bacillus sp. (in: firmicutes)]
MSLTIQFNTMIAMIIMGAWLGAALDTYGRFLKRPKRASWFLFVNDILFWVVQALLFFYVLLHVNEGQLRFYIILAILCGFAAYQSLLKNIYVKLLESVIKASIWTYQFIHRIIINLIVRPVKMLIQFLLVTIIFLGNVIVKILKLVFFIIYTPIKWVFQILWRFMPQKFTIFLRRIAGFFIRRKNNIVKWWKSFRN